MRVSNEAENEEPQLQNKRGGNTNMCHIIEKGYEKMRYKSMAKLSSIILVFALIFTSSAVSFAEDRLFLHHDISVEVEVNVGMDTDEDSEFNLDLFDMDEADALAYVLAEQQFTGVLGFEDDYTLPDDGTYISVIALFDSLPAPIQVIVEPDLPEAVAEAIVEAEHEDFREEAAELFGVDEPIEEEFIFDDEPMIIDGEIPFVIDFEYRLALNGVGLTLPADMVYELAALDSVRAVYPLPEARVPEVSEEIDEVVARDAETNDPAGNQEGRAFMRANELHALGIKGKGVVVAVVDGGVDPRHASLWGAFITYEEQLRRTPDNPHLTEAHNIGGNFYGRSFPTGNNVNTWRTFDPRHTDNHGTHVTGTVLGRDTGSANGILGVAPEAITFHYRVGNRIAAIEMALHDKPDLCTMSMGANAYNSPVNVETVAYNNALLQNPWLVWVNAANNTGPWFYTADTPDASPLVFAVGNARIDGHGNPDEPTRAGANNSSGRGPVAISHTILPHMMAHGTSVLSTNALPAAVGSISNTLSQPILTTAQLIANMPDDLTLAQREPQSRMTGCSMAAPHTAGAVALMMSYDMAQNDGARTWDRKEIRARLMNNAMWIANEYESVHTTGAGFIDVYAAIFADTVVSVTYDKVATISTTVNHPNNAANYNTTKNTWRNNVFRTGDAADLSFGSHDSLAEFQPVTLTAHLKNASNVDRVYSLTSHFRKNPDAAASLAFPATIAVPANTTVDFDVTFHLNKAIAADVDFELYEGLLYINLGNEKVAHLPFSYVLGCTGFFTLGGGATGNRPVNPAGMNDLEVYRPVISTNLAMQLNRASGMLGINMTRYQTTTSTLRINRSTGELVTAFLNAFSLGTLPFYHGETDRYYMLDRSTQNALGGAVYTEGSYILNVLPTSSTQANQANVNPRDYISIPFDIDNTPPALSNVKASEADGKLTITGNVFDAWAADAALRGVTFPIVRIADPNGNYLSPNVDQSYNAVWVQVGDNPSVRADVGANGDFKAELEPMGISRAMKIWAIDNYTLIPAVDRFRSAATNTTYDWAADAKPYFVPGGFVSDDRFEGFVWSGLNVIERTVITSLRLDALSITTMARGETRDFHLLMNEGAAKEQIVWTIADPSLGYVDQGVVTIFDKTGNVRLTATDPVSGLSHSITIRIAS